MTREHFKKYLAKAGGNAGPCGWALAELKMVHNEVMDQLCILFEVMEKAGLALPTSCVGDVTMIPKGEETNGVEGLRPITVLSVLHRLYAAARLDSSLMEWQNKVVGDLPLRACRPKNGTDDLLIPLALALEEVEEEMFGASYDLSKAFDSLAFEVEEDENGSFTKEGVGWTLLEKLGFPEKISNVMKDMYCQIKRRFKVNGHLGATVTAEGKKGCVQGCAMSMIFCNAMTIMWFRAQEKGIDLSDKAWKELATDEKQATKNGGAAVRKSIASKAKNLRVGGYADDIHAVSTSMDEIRRAHVISLAWSAVCGAAFNPKKSIALGKIKLSVGDKVIDMVSKFKILGRVLSIDGDLVEAPQERDKEMSRRLRNLAQIPGSREDRLGVAATCVLPILFGMEAAHKDKKKLDAEQRRQRNEVWTAARAGKPPSNYQCQEVLFTVCSKGHLVDPCQFIDYRTVGIWMRWLASTIRPQDERVLEKVWKETRPKQRIRGKAKVNGTSGIANKFSGLLRSIGWDWVGPRSFSISGVV